MSRSRTLRRILTPASLTLISFAFLVLLAGLVGARNQNDAAQTSLAFLATSAGNWQSSHDCYGCHVQAQAIIGLSIAKHNGYAIDQTVLDSLVAKTLSQQYDDGGIRNKEGGGEAIASSVLAASALALYDRYVATYPDPYTQTNFISLTNFIAQAQQADGSWQSDHNGGLIYWEDGSAIEFTGRSLMALTRANSVQPAVSFTNAIGAGLAYLDSTTIVTSSHLIDVAWRIIGRRVASALGYGAEITVTQDISVLLSLQQADGGWGPNDPSYNGYGTNALSVGLALYALQQGGFDMSSEAFDRGILWLLTNQNGDGSWTVGGVTPFGSTMWAATTLGAYVDASPPAVTISQPAPGSSTANRTIAISGSILDVNIYTYTVEYRSGATPDDWTLSEVYTPTAPGVRNSTLATLDATGLSDGIYSLRVTAGDVFSHTGVATTTFRLDTIPPTVTELLAIPPQVSWTGLVNVTARASDPDGEVSGAAARVDDNAPDAMSAEGGFGQATITVTYSIDPWGLALGQHSVGVWAQDSAGNSGAPISATFTVTNPPPIINSVYPANGSLSISTAVTITGTGFLTTPTVYVSDTLLASVSRIDDSHLRVIVPAGLGVGTYNWRVVNPDGQDAILPGAFTVPRSYTYLPIVLKIYRDGE